MTTYWLVTDGQLWPKLTPSRQADIKAWLRMHEIDPHRVPLASEIRINGADDNWRIEYERYLVDEDGNIRICPEKKDEAFVEECTTPLTVDPPMEWLIPFS